MTSAIDHIERIEAVLYRLRSQSLAGRRPTPPGAPYPAPGARPTAGPLPADTLDFSSQGDGP
jgi:hypothetical protein